jgi:hypothetical protein
VLGVDAKPEHSFNENDQYQMSILADFAAIAFVNARMVSNLESRAGQSAAQGTGSAGPSSTRSPVPDLTESIDEAKYLSRELRNLASAAQVLAAKLEVQSSSG